jgi:cytochrome b
VWDPFVRIFHWSLVAAMAYELIFEPGTKAHVYVGYYVIAIVSLRMVWGLIGTRHARFSDFVKSPAAVAGYLKSLLSGNPRHYLGHNPAGGWMVVVLLIMAAITGFTGYAMKTDALWGEEWIEQLHEFCANGMIGLIALHVLGVIVSSYMHRENLVSAMITGKKQKH